MARTTPDPLIRRMTVISGFLLVLLGLVSTVAPLALPHPDIGDGAPAIVAYLISERSSLLVGFYVFALGWGALLLVFTTGLWSILARAEGESSPLAMLGFVGGIVLATMVFMIAAIGATAAFQPAADDSAGARLLYQFLFMMVNFGAFPTIVNVLPFSIVMIRTGTIRRWIGWIGVATAFAHLVASLAFATHGPMASTGIIPSLAPVVYMVWVLCTSVVLLRAPSFREEAATERPAFG